MGKTLEQAIAEVAALPDLFSRETTAVWAGSRESELARLVKEMNFLTAHRSSYPICPAMQSASAGEFLVSPGPTSRWDLLIAATAGVNPTSITCRDATES